MEFGKQEESENQQAYMLHLYIHIHIYIYIISQIYIDLEYLVKYSCHKERILFEIKKKLILQNAERLSDFLSLSTTVSRTQEMLIKEPLSIVMAALIMMAIDAPLGSRCTDGLAGEKQTLT